jgi:hypothetical protein
VFCVVGIILLGSCDKSIEVIDYEFGQLPNRIIYVIGVDTELDFSGATIRSVQRNGVRGNERLLTPSDWIRVNHSIDFTVPGVYKVDITIGRNHERKFNIYYLIQVIDEEIINQILHNTVDE